MWGEGAQLEQHISVLGAEGQNHTSECGKGSLEYDTFPGYFWPCARSGAALAGEYSTSVAQTGMVVRRQSLPLS